MLHTMIGTLKSQMDDGKYSGTLVEYGVRDGNGYMYEVGSLDESVKAMSNTGLIAF